MPRHRRRYPWRHVPKSTAMVLNLPMGMPNAPMLREMAQRLGAGEQDEAYLAALEHGLPTCAGIAVGFDRMVMVATGKQHIAEVMPFLGTYTNQAIEMILWF